jgi:hypothetical protein
MNTKKIVWCVLAAVIGGCLPTSVHRLYTDKDIVFDSNLIGLWSDKPDANNLETWEFRAVSEPNAYEMIYTGKDGDSEKYGSAAFITHLVKLDDKLFLDVFPRDPNMQSNIYGRLHFVPVHSFIKIEQIQPTLQMRLMDHDKLKQLLKEKSDVLKHEIGEDERLVLTASTEQLQAFMRQYADVNDGIFDSPCNLRRLPQER